MKFETGDNRIIPGCLAVIVGVFNDEYEHLVNQIVTVERRESPCWQIPGTPAYLQREPLTRYSEYWLCTFKEPQKLMEVGSFFLGTTKTIYGTQEIFGAPQLRRINGTDLPTNELEVFSTQPINSEERVRVYEEGYRKAGRKIVKEES